MEKWHGRSRLLFFITATLAGVPQVVAFTADALLGASLEDGKILWRVPLETNAKRHAATPVIDGDNVIVNSHTIGLVAFRISKDSGGLKAAPAWANQNLKINLATPVLVDGHLYCQGANKDYICVEAETGNSSGRSQALARDGGIIPRLSPPVKTFSC